MTEAIDERMHRSLAERALGPVQARLAIDTGYGDLIAAARVPDTTGTPAPERAKLEQTPGADFSDVRDRAASESSSPGQRTLTGALQAKVSHRDAAASPATVDWSEGAGAPLPDDVRGKMERSFAADFADVRVHVGDRADSIGARAVTHGVSLHFAPGEYDPGSRAGQELIGHELAHVVQQREGRVATPRGKDAAVVDDRALEAEADRAGALAAAGEPVGSAGPAGATSLCALQRKVKRNDADTEWVHESGKRPSWRADLKRNILTELSAIRGHTVSALPSDVQRAHRVSYHDIVEVVLAFMNGTIDESVLNEITDAFYPDHKLPAYSGMKADRGLLRDSLKAKASNSTLRVAANSLISYLNSAISNVSPGDASTNMSNQEHFDPRLTPSPGGTTTVLSPFSHKVAATLHPLGFLTSPKFKPDQTISSSQLGSHSGAKPFMRDDWKQVKQSFATGGASGGGAATTLPAVKPHAPFAGTTAASGTASASATATAAAGTFPSGAKNLAPPMSAKPMMSTPPIGSTGGTPVSTFGAPPMSSPPLQGPPPPMLVKPLFPPGTVIQVTLFGPPRVLSPSEVTVLVAQIGQLQSKGMHPLLVAQLVMSQGFVFF